MGDIFYQLMPSIPSSKGPRDKAGAFFLLLFWGGGEGGFYVFSYLLFRNTYTGCLKKTEFSGYAGCDVCDGPMEGGRGLKKNYIQSSYTNTQIQFVQIHKHTQIHPQIQFEIEEK